MWIKHDGTTITGVFSGRVKEGGIEVPEDARIHKGDKLAMFDKEWNRRPMDELIAEGLVTPPEGMVWDDGWRPATDRELVEAGRETVDEREKLVGDDIVQKSDEELYNEGILTGEETNDYLERQRLGRIAEIDAESVPLLRVIAVGRETQADRDRLDELELEYVQLQIEERR